MLRKSDPSDVEMLMQNVEIIENSTVSNKIYLNIKEYNMTHMVLKG